MMLNADYVVDMGPKAGRLGGEVVFAGTPGEMLKADITYFSLPEWEDGDCRPERAAERKRTVHHDKRGERE